MKHKNVSSDNISARRGGRGGFTLIELIFVLVMIGLLAGFAVPQFISSQRHLRLDFSRQLLHTTLSQGFSEARSDLNIRVVSGETGGQEVFLKKCAFVTDPLNNFSSTDDCEEEDTAEILLERDVFLPEGFEIWFFPPLGDMHFVDRSESEILLSVENFSGETKTIRVHPASGFIQKIPNP